MMLQGWVRVKLGTSESEQAGTQDADDWPVAFPVICRPVPGVKHGTETSSEKGHESTLGVAST